MTTRTINKKLIKEWIKVQGKGALVKLAYESGCSFSLVNKLIAENYSTIPSIAHLDGLCRALDCDLDTLLPFEESESA
jgi:DNA-binding Xre family transcriptional regulator